MSDVEHWQNVYQTKNQREVSWFQARSTLSLSLIEQALQNRHKAVTNVIDVGCGTSYLADDLLVKFPIKLTLTDISPKALELVEERLIAKRLLNSANEVTFVPGDICRFQNNARFNIWHDRAVFHFLTTPMQREQYVDVLKQHCESGADIYIATFALDGPKKCSGLPIVQYDAEKITKMFGLNFQLVDVHRERHQTPFATEQSFNYFHFKKN